VRGKDHFPDNEETVADDLYKGLIEFFYSALPQFVTNPFYIFGEAFGAHYAPVIATTIITNNSLGIKKINLQGLGIASGWMAPYPQTESYMNYLYSLGMISLEELEVARYMFLDYVLYYSGDDAPQAIAAGLWVLEHVMYDAGVKNMYNIKLASDPTVPLIAALNTTLNSAAFKLKLNVTGVNASWQYCSPQVYKGIGNEQTKDVAKLLPNILDNANLPVLVYNGNLDLATNIMGAKWWTDAMVWDGYTAFEAAPVKQWNGPSGTSAGTYKTAQGFTRVVVNNAGQMTSYDQPANVQSLINQWLTGQLT